MGVFASTAYTNELSGDMRVAGDGNFLQVSVQSSESNGSELVRDSSTGEILDTGDIDSYVSGFDAFSSESLGGKLNLGDNTLSALSNGAHILDGAALNDDTGFDILQSGLCQNGVMEFKAIWILLT